MYGGPEKPKLNPLALATHNILDVATFQSSASRWSGGSSRYVIADGKIGTTSLAQSYLVENGVALPVKFLQHEVGIQNQPLDLFAQELQVFDPRSKTLFLFARFLSVQQAHLNDFTALRVGRGVSVINRTRYSNNVLMTTSVLGITDLQSHEFEAATKPLNIGLLMYGKALDLTQSNYVYSVLLDQVPNFTPPQTYRNYQNEGVISQQIIARGI